MIHSIKGSAQFLTSAGFDLGKDQRLPIPTDKIDLSAARSTEVSSENLPAEPLKMARCLFFSPDTQGQMSLRTGRWLGRPVKNRGDDAGKGHILSAYLNVLRWHSPDVGQIHTGEIHDPSPP